MRFGCLPALSFQPVIATVADPPLVRPLLFRGVAIFYWWFRLGVHSYILKKKKIMDEKEEMYDPPKLWFLRNGSFGAGLLIAVLLIFYYCLYRGAIALASFFY